MNQAAFGPAGFGAPEILVILLVLVFLFGAKKLPEMARGTGRAMRIFKAETKGLADDDDDATTKNSEPGQIESTETTSSDLPPTHTDTTQRHTGDTH